MRIAFYAPLKSPDHPTPSGDRLMARLLLAALRRCGHDVEIVSRLRAFTRVPSADGLASLRRGAEMEQIRIAADWRMTGVPDLWFTYHTYYKAPDLIGPLLARDCGIPYVTAEASLSSRRAEGPWAPYHETVVEAVRQAAVNVCFTARDRAGLEALVPGVRCADLPPFIDAAAWVEMARERQTSATGPVRLACVAMMRAGDKFDSFVMLAAALERIAGLDWQLAIIGDGPERPRVEALFAGLPAGRLRWLGELPPARVAAELAASDLYVWPGTGEAYGLAYLEAQAVGLPVVAQATGGVPEVVRDQQTGLLVPFGDTGAFADAVGQLITGDGRRREMGLRARAFGAGERSLEGAADILAPLLTAVMAETAQG